MNSAICTLFEGHYDLGLIALTNSLYKNGFRGEIYAGYKGSLPSWAVSSTDKQNFIWDGSSSYKVADGLNIHFLPVETKMHLANYKPYFLLKVAELLNREKGIVYFDPDIVITCQWEFYERWMGYGVALVHELVSNDMPETHPIRQEWHKVIHKTNKKVLRKLNSYINSGFCAVTSSNLEFIETWADIMDVGIEHFQLGAEVFAHNTNRSNIFFAKDQDALNIAAMCCNSPISEIGPEGMGFIHGGFTMSHAVGSPKPWKKNFMLASLMGDVPSLAEKAYWSNVNSVIITHSPFKLNMKLLAIKCAAIIGRFYRRY